MILDHGFGSTTVDAVVGRAGITKGAFFHHFAAKTDLASIKTQWEEATAAFSAGDATLAADKGRGLFKKPIHERVELADLPPLEDRADGDPTVAVGDELGHRPDRVTRRDVTRAVQGHRAPIAVAVLVPAAVVLALLLFTPGGRAVVSGDVD